jgi:hypothetical protein
LRYVPRFNVVCPNSPAADPQTTERNAGTFTTVTCTRAPSRSAPVIPMMRIRGSGIAVFYPGSQPGEQQSGTAATFDEARADFGSAWEVFLSKRTEADFQA